MYTIQLAFTYHFLFFRHPCLVVYRMFILLEGVGVWGLLTLFSNPLIPRVIEISLSFNHPQSCLGCLVTPHNRIYLQENPKPNTNYRVNLINFTLCLSNGADCKKILKLSIKLKT